MVPDPQKLLPLSAPVFQILIALAAGDQHGYAIMQDVAARTNDRMRLSPGTLYGAIRRLLVDGLIQELDARPDRANDDERRRYYRLTDFGRRVAEAEAARVTEALRDARSSGLVPRAT